MSDKSKLDPVHASDRTDGSTPPESAAQSSNVVGRPKVEDTTMQSHESAEGSEKDRATFSDQGALSEGGSFDGLGVPAAEK